MKRLFLVSCSFMVCVACSHDSGAADRHYHLTGQVKALDASQHTAQIDAAAIPNYMEAMTMDYPIKSEADFKQLRVGERIEATVNVHGDNSYDLTDLHAAAPAKQ